MPVQQAAHFTTYGWAVCLWVLIGAFQYGYHISVLNQIHSVLICADDTIPSGPSPMVHNYPTCFPMSNVVFSAVTSVFTIGGLFGSAIANLVMDGLGRRGAARTNAALIALGTTLMSIGGSVGVFGTGRFLVGVGSGVGICLVPIYLAEIAPSNIRGNVGVLTQLAIVFGIMITQALGLRFSTPLEWRVVLVSSFGLAALQLLLSPWIVESPVWIGRSRSADKKLVIAKIWTSPMSAITDERSVDRENDPLLSELEAQGDPTQAGALTVPQIFAAPQLRKPLTIICLAMASQQLSGINAVLYYSNNILSKALPQSGPYVSLGVTIVNVIMTFPPIILIERLGRKELLFLSASGALFSLWAVGFGLDTGRLTLSSVTIIAFVTSFAIGLGPIPFVMIPEIAPPYAVSALSSVALSLNWMINFLVGFIFLPLRDWLAGGDAKKEGRVFYVFAAVLFVSTFALFKTYRG